MFQAAIDFIFLKFSSSEELLDDELDTARFRTGAAIGYLGTSFLDAYLFKALFFLSCDEEDEESEEISPFVCFYFLGS